MTSARSNRGFSLIELIVVIVLIAIVAVVAVPRTPGPSIGLPALAEQVAADIRLAQSLSMTQGQRHCLVFGASSYQLRNTNCTVAINHPVAGSTDVTLNGATAATTNLTGNAIEFDGRGSPTTLTVATSNGTVTLSLDGDNRTVTISPQTGRVSP